MFSNTSQSYGLPARALHWLTALLILSAIALGLYAEDLPRETSAQAETLKSLYSLHKTIGVAAFFTALLRILWALTQPKPVPLHPERKAETTAAEVVHWALYGAMLIMPLSGWIMHAAESGFAPILWPFGQDLPFVPKSEALAHSAQAVHKLSALVLYGSVGLHVAGALKHALIDRDATLARMTRGVAAGGPPLPHGVASPLVALALWAGVIGVGLTLPQDTPAAPAPALSEATVSEGNWQVSEGSLAFNVIQMGAAVEGSLPNWTATIHYDEISGTGDVRVEIDTTALRIGSVTDQAKGPEFFDTLTHPTAVFEATLTRDTDAAHLAQGTLSLRGAVQPVTLPFTLEIDGDTARMRGETALDRRDFGMGAGYTDEATVGFTVIVSVDLTATRAD